MGIIACYNHQCRLHLREDYECTRRQSWFASKCFNSDGKIFNLRTALLTHSRVSQPIRRGLSLTG